MVVLSFRRMRIQIIRANDLVSPGDRNDNY